MLNFFYENFFYIGDSQADSDFVDYIIKNKLIDGVIFYKFKFKPSIDDLNIEIYSIYNNLFETFNNTIDKNIHKIYTYDNSLD